MLPDRPQIGTEWEKGRKCHNRATELNTEAASAKALGLEQLTEPAALGQDEVRFRRKQDGVGQGRCEGKPQDGLEQGSDKNRSLTAGGAGEKENKAWGPVGGPCRGLETRRGTGWEEASQRLSGCQDGMEEQLHEQATPFRVGPCE